MGSPPRVRRWGRRGQYGEQLYYFTRWLSLWVGSRGSLARRSSGGPPTPHFNTKPFSLSFDRRLRASRGGGSDGMPSAHKQHGPLVRPPASVSPPSGLTVLTPPLYTRFHRGFNTLPGRGEMPGRGFLTVFQARRRRGFRGLRARRAGAGERSRSSRHTVRTLVTQSRRVKRKTGFPPSLTRATSESRARNPKKASRKVIPPVRSPSRAVRRPAILKTLAYPGAVAPRPWPGLPSGRPRGWPRGALP